jgi:hypothetical protein
MLVMIAAGKRLQIVSKMVQEVFRGALLLWKRRQMLVAGSRGVSR